MTGSRLLAVYLNNHLAGATAGVELFRRVASQQTETPEGDELHKLADEIDADRESLIQLMRTLGIRKRRLHEAAGWLGERAGRLKTNGRLMQRSPVSDVLELEALRNAVLGKLCGWQTLRAVALEEPRLDRVQLESLIERAEDQSHRLYEIHLRIVQRRVEDGDVTTTR
jgi:hypothetical protein